MTLLMDQVEVASAAYRLTSDGMIPKAAGWQADLYARLSAPESDAGYLLLGPSGVGKTESILIPSLGVHRGGAPRRLFLIGPDGATLDDPLYRLTPYLKAWAAADETPRTLCLDTALEAEAEDLCRRFLPDGTEEALESVNPLEADVDLVLTTFSRFRALFFGSGGVHALPSTFVPEDPATLRRDLFFFDEAHAYTTEAFARFHRLIEFLFAEDTDVVVASSAMPASFQEELSFLECLRADGGGPARTLTYCADADPLAAMEARIRRDYFQNSRVIGVTETVADAEALHARLLAAYPHSVYLYHTELAPAPRRRLYAQLRELEKEGEGYLLLTTGPALETSDLDASVLLTTLCPPENLIQRIGRCNRRGDLPEGRVLIYGADFAEAARPLNPVRETAYRETLRTAQEIPYEPGVWSGLI